MDDRLNFIIVQGEDTGRHQGCYGDAYARTPNIDRLARGGVRFRNAFSTAPVCAPSRSSMVSGQHAIKTGAHLMRSHLRQVPRLFTDVLREQGYHVNWANKTDFNFSGFEATRMPDDRVDARSDWISEMKCGSLPKEPFFLYFNYGQTHESGMWPPGTRWAGHDVDPVGPLPDPGIDGFDLAAMDGLDIPPYLPDTPTVRASLYRYYRHLENQDRLLGRVIDAVDRMDLRKNTVIIYLTDHGRGLVREKRWLYEAGWHLPLIVSGPGIEEGVVRDDLVSWVDIAPTILTLAGAPVPPEYDGRVFLGDKRQPEPQYVFAGRDRMDSVFDRVRAARDRRYLYLRNDAPHLPYAQANNYMELSPVTREIRELHAAGKLAFPNDVWMAKSKAQEELYDTQVDPHCIHNLAARSDHAAVLLRMREATESWRDRCDDKGRYAEETLIERGLIEDERPFFHSWRHQLPEHLRGGGAYDACVRFDAPLTGK
jgi:arylsulfatase A-like enzyme